MWIYPRIEISVESEPGGDIRLMISCNWLCSETRFLPCQPNSFYSGTSRVADPGNCKYQRQYFKTYEFMNIIKAFQALVILLTHITIHTNVLQFRHEANNISNQLQYSHCTRLPTHNNIDRDENSANLFLPTDIAFLLFTDRKLTSVIQLGRF